VCVFQLHASRNDKLQAAPRQDWDRRMCSNVRPEPQASRVSKISFSLLTLRTNIHEVQHKTITRRQRASSHMVSPSKITFSIMRLLFHQGVPTVTSLRPPISFSGSIRVPFDRVVFNSNCNLVATFRTRHCGTIRRGSTSSNHIVNHTRLWLA